MVARVRETPRFRTFAEVQARLGDVPPERVLINPAPGTATPDDLLNPAITRYRACELVDGILLEKPMGSKEDGIGLWLAVQIFNFASPQNLGKVFGAQGGFVEGGMTVRLPDVSFYRWDSVEDADELDRLTRAFVQEAPDLVVEVLSPSNTAKEMAIKLAEYEAVGVELTWYVDPETRTVTVYPKGKVRRSKVLTEADTLDGGKVLPGFALPVRELFASRVPANLPKKPKKKRK
jgi:Uma2 family endonuclease